MISIWAVSHFYLIKSPLFHEAMLFVLQFQDGMKMGKSLGNTLEPKDLVDRFGVDAVRYFFLREVEFGNDGDYSEERFINTVNAHLANTIGIYEL
jgi:methionyl-tRNA synthetase